MKREGFEVVLARSLAQARAEMGQCGFGILVLDWMLPDGQGIDLLREIRVSHPRLPVLMLTARAELVDKVVGLETGANDYITKPFEPRELIARIRVQERLVALPAATGPAEERLIVAGIELHLAAREARYRGELVSLTKMEFDLLRLLCENPGRVFSREELLNRVWGYERFPTTRTVDTHVLQLRQKFSDELFETVRGIGYRLLTQS